ncbi:hypothetical protein ACFQ0B_36025 [Nonomuraea thailandensis]
MRHLRAGLPPARLGSGPVPVPLRAELDRSLSYHVLIAVHERAARHFEALAERGFGDTARHRERAAWHGAAASRAREAGAAWAASFRASS